MAQATFTDTTQVFQGGLYDLGMHPGGRPTSKPRSSLGQRIAEARERAGISQVELAEKLGVAQPRIVYWERKAENIRSDVLAKIAEILDTSTDELLGTKPPSPRAAKPVGRARQLFDSISKLPRRQQEKIISILEPFVQQHIKEAEEKKD
jgi:transcriptional regulator with XRE-family HTH domain